MGDSPWLTVGPDTAAQLAYRDRLLAEVPEVVLALDPQHRLPAEELMDEVLGQLPGVAGYAVGQGNTKVTRPDGQTVAVDRSAPLATLGHLVAEDFCLLSLDADGRHRLVGAVLCFPSRWSLAEKMGHPLDTIHDPVPDYGLDLARRVERIFTNLRTGRALVRANWLVHGTAELHLPMRSDEKAPAPADPSGRLFLRTERQTLLRLPRSALAVFAIRTAICPLSALSPAEARALARELAALDPETIAYRAGSDLHARALENLASFGGHAANRCTS